MKIGDLLIKHLDAFALLYKDPLNGLTNEALFNGTFMVLLSKPERIQQMLTHGSPGDFVILCKVLLDDGRIRWVRKAHIKVV